MGIQSLYTKQYSASYPTDALLLVENPHRTFVGPKYAVVGFHGHNGSAATWGPNYQSFSPNDHFRVLAESGFVCAGPDLELPNWGDPQSVRTMDDLYTWLTATYGCQTKIGLYAYSMGGLSSLNWARRNISKVSAIYLWAPATDLDYFHSTVGAPTYGMGSLPNDATWTAEINTGFTQGTTVSGSASIPVSTNPTGVTVTVADAKQMSDNGTATTAGGSFTYTGKTDTTLTGCKSTAGAFTVNNLDVLTTTYAGQEAGYNPMENAAAFGTLCRANNVPVRLSYGVSDTVVPPGMHTAYAAAFGSGITLNPVTGDHTSLFFSVPYEDVTDHFRNAGTKPRPTWREIAEVEDVGGIVAGYRTWSG